MLRLRLPQAPADPQFPFSSGSAPPFPAPKLFRSCGRKIVSNAQSPRALRGPGARNGAEAKLPPHYVNLILTAVSALVKRFLRRKPACFLNLIKVL